MIWYLCYLVSGLIWWFSTAESPLHCPNVFSLSKFIISRSITQPNLNRYPKSNIYSFIFILKSICFLFILKRSWLVDISLTKNQSKWKGIHILIQNETVTQILPYDSCRDGVIACDTEIQNDCAMIICYNFVTYGKSCVCAIFFTAFFLRLFGSLQTNGFSWCTSININLKSFSKWN